MPSSGITLAKMFHLFRTHSTDLYVCCLYYYFQTVTFFSGIVLSVLLLLLLFSHSVVSDSLWPQGCSTLGFLVLRDLLELTQTHVHWADDAIQPSHPLLPPCPCALNLSQHQDLFQRLAVRIKWPKYWSFSIRPSSEYSELISFRIVWFDLPVAEGTLKSLLQHHSLKGSILWCWASFMVQLSHLYMTTGKTIVLTRWTFVCKMMSLLFNTLSRFVIAFLSRSKSLLIWGLQSPSTVILEPKKIKSVTLSIVFPSICHKVMGLDAIVFFWTLNFKPGFHCPFSSFKRLFSSSSLSTIRMLSSEYLRLLIFLLAILIPAWDLSSPECHMMYSACKLNK